MTRLSTFIKRKIMTSPLAVMAKKIEAYFQLRGMTKEDSKILGHRTIYCISPYKTGTTYISTCFNNDIALHEPMQYASLTELNKDFDALFLKRLNTLNLKLECSGFWSGYIDELAKHKFAKDLTYICVVRRPSSWVTSVVNYWSRSRHVLERYDFINDLFWKPKAGVDIRTILSSDEVDREASIKKLLDFYMDFTRQTRKLDGVVYIHLNELRDYMPAIGDLIDEKPNFDSAWRRENKGKSFVYVNPEIDKEYEELIESFTKNDAHEKVSEVKSEILNQTK